MAAPPPALPPLQHHVLNGNGKAVGLVRESGLDFPAFKRRDGAEGAAVAQNPQDRLENNDELGMPTFLSKRRG
jgi:hypothetical protein